MKAASSDIAPRYEVIKWSDGYNVADNTYLNVVAFSFPMSKEQATAEANRLNKI